MKTLIIEDDPHIAQILITLLAEQNYSCYHACSITDALNSICNPSWKPNLVILDRLIGYEDSVQLIPLILKNNPQAKILILSSLNTAVERAQTLDLGADDYMGKPFSQSELLSRIRALLRRQGAPTSSQIKILGNTRIDFNDHRVYVLNSPVLLTQKEYQILTLMAKSPQKIFNKFEILERAWDISSGTESNVVEAIIKNLRKKLEQSHSDIKIMSKRQMGYWIEA